MIRFLEHAGVAGLLLCGGVASAVAQTPCDTCVFDVHRLGEATATGHRQHHTQNVAAKTLSATDIRRNLGNTFASTLTQVEGVSLVQTGATIAKPVLHGMYGNRLLIVNNGVRQQGQQWGADHAPELDANAAASISVVKGAEAVRYGGEALGGVVLLDAKPLPYGRRTVDGTVSLLYGSNGRRGALMGIADGAFSLRQGDAAWRVQGTYVNGGDRSTADYLLNNTGYNTISLSAMGGWQGRKLTATLFSSIYYQRSGIYYASKISDLDQLLKRFEYGRPDPESFFPFSYRIKPPFQQSQHVTLKGELKWAISKQHQVDFTLSFQENLRQEFENRKKDQWSWIPVQDLILKTYKFDVLWHAKWRLWNMSTEAGLSNTYQTNFNYPGTKQPAFVPNFAALSMGGFFLHKAQFGKLQCALGARYDFRVMSVNGYTSLSNYTYYDDFKLYSNFTASLAGHYQFNEQWDVRANVGWSWRPPDINELYAIGLQDGSYWVVGNRHLASERGYKSVFGARYRTPWLSVEPSFFYQRINSYIYDHIGTGKDRFQNRPNGKYPKFIYDQDNVRLYGGDVEVTVKPLNDLTFVGKGEWTFARNITRNDWLPFMPSDRYGLSGNYARSFSSGKKYRASLSLSGIYVTKQRRFDPDKDLVSDSPAGYFLLNGTLDFSINFAHKRQWKIMLVGENMLNALYKEYTDRFRYYAHERGVNYSLRTIYKF